MADQSVYGRQRHLFFASEIGIEGSLCHPGFARHAVHRHLLIAITGQKTLYGIENGVRISFV
ncbi:MAG TPA: hypothetical protein VFB38_11200 [Chthonomonadaceae bacterium]|nr:hypothetical protein [Chthonomonadaceae bacterium]